MSEKNTETVAARLQTTLATGDAIQEANAGQKTTSGTGAAGEADSNTVIRSLSDLKEKAPKVYDQMMKGIAQTIISQMKHSQERISEMWREMRNK
jgi:hypothetical protein